MNTWVPYDDESCWIFCYAWHPDREISAEEQDRYLSGNGLFAEVDADFMPVRRRENDYLLDRDLQRTTNFTGIANISEQDQAVADSQGRIADRTRELLVQTDVGVTRFRSTILKACNEAQAGHQPKGASNPNACFVRSGDYIAPSSQSLMDVVQTRFGTLAGTNILYPQAR